MLAVIGVLNESFTESLRGFYRLRQAFNTLYEITEAEKLYMEKHVSGSQTSLSTNKSSHVSTPANGSNVDGKGADQDLPAELDRKLDLAGDETRPASGSGGLSEATEDEIDFRTVSDNPVGLRIKDRVYVSNQSVRSTCLYILGLHSAMDCFSCSCRWSHQPFRSCCQSSPFEETVRPAWLCFGVRHGLPTISMVA